MNTNRSVAHRSRIQKGVRGGGRFATEARGDSAVATQGLTVVDEWPTDDFAGPENPSAETARPETEPFEEPGGMFHGLADMEFDTFKDQCSEIRSQIAYSAWSQADSEAMRDALRSHLGSEVTGTDGDAQRVRFLELESRRLYARSGRTLDAPTNVAEAHGLLDDYEFNPRYGAWSQEKAKVAVDIAMTHPDLARRVCELAHDKFDDPEPGSSFDQYNQFVDQATMWLAASPITEVRRSVAENAHAKSPAVDRLARDADPSVRYSVAKRASEISFARQVRTPHLSSVELDERERLLGATQRDRDGRETVEMLERLASDPDTRVRRAMAQATSFPSRQSLEALATDRDPMVRYLLATGIRGKKVHTDIVDRLARDPEPAIREQIAAAGLRPTATDGQWVVRRRAS